MNFKKSIALKLVILPLLSVVILSGCIREKQSPGYEYMPDMYRGPQIEAYVDYGEIRDTLHSELMHTMSARQPAVGSVPMTENVLNDMPYPYPNTMEGYEQAGALLKSPLAQTEANIKQGELIYNNFCLQCHGAKGEGDGTVVTVGNFPPPPSYSNQLKDLPEGKMFHTITYGKNNMGSHASQLTKTDRWKVIAYVKTLQNPGSVPVAESGDANAASDSTKTVATPN